MSYGTIAEADVYLASNQQWLAQTTEAKQKNLDRSEVYLDSLCWQGSLTDTLQTIAWPRTGVIDQEGRTVDPDTIPVEITNAFFECAALDMTGSLYAPEESSVTAKTVSAGSVSVSKNYSEPSSPPPAHGMWVDTLISQYMCQLEEDHLLRA